MDQLVVLKLLLGVRSVEHWKWRKPRSGLNEVYHILITRIQWKLLYLLFILDIFFMKWIFCYTNSITCIHVAHYKLHGLLNF